MHSPIALFIVSMLFLASCYGQKDELTHSMKNLDRSIASLALALLEDKSLPPTDAVELGDEIRAFQSNLVKERPYDLPGRKNKYAFHLRASAPLREMNERVPKKIDPYEIETMKDNKMTPQFLEGQSMRQKLKDYLKKFELESDVSITDEDIEAANHPLDLSKYVLPTEDYSSHFIRVDTLNNDVARADILTAVDKEDTEMVKDQFGNDVPVIPGIDANGIVSNDEVKEGVKDIKLEEPKIDVNNEQKAIEKAVEEAVENAVEKAVEKEEEKEEEKKAIEKAIEKAEEEAEKDEEKKEEEKKEEKEEPKEEPKEEKEEPKEEPKEEKEEPKEEPKEEKKEEKEEPKEEPKEEKEEEKEEPKEEKEEEPKEEPKEEKEEKTEEDIEDLADEAQENMDNTENKDDGSKDN